MAVTDAVISAYVSCLQSCCRCVHGDIDLNWLSWCCMICPYHVSTDPPRAQALQRLQDARVSVSQEVQSDACLRSHRPCQLQVSLEEVERLAGALGFRTLQRAMVPAAFNANLRSMMQMSYRAAFWTMQKGALTTPA